MIVDNLLNASEETLNRIELISGKRPDFFNIDIRKEEDFDKVFKAHPDIDSVIHFAALKVGRGLSWILNCNRSFGFCASIMSLVKHAEYY